MKKTPIVLLVIAIAIIAVGVWYTLNQKTSSKISIASNSKFRQKNQWGKVQNQMLYQML